jgi:asparagine synthase (glutamine-hydrolysing)
VQAENRPTAGAATMAPLAPPGMSPLEVAAGYPVGFGREARPPPVDLAPLAALEEVISGAVRRPPCCVAFSGGRDSSLVLLAATRAAANQGCEPPVALTARFGPASTDEAGWQRLVLDHLRLEGHVVLDVPDELDLLGPVATGELRRRGALFPANTHSLVPLLAHAAGGSLLVGLGGDELLDGHAWTRLNDALARRRRPSASDALRLGAALLPDALRTRLVAARRGLEPPRWLREHAASELRRLERAAASEPVRFDRTVDRASRARTVLVALESLKALSAEVRIEAPLLDRRFVAAVARAGGARGWGDRAAAMHAIAGGLLPEALLNRRDKARFDADYFGAASRRFAERWTGEGVDTTLVDPEALRREWLRAEPDFRSALPMQVAWLHDFRAASRHA